MKKTNERPAGDPCPYCGLMGELSIRCAHCGMRLSKKKTAVLFRFFLLVTGLGILFFLHLHLSGRNHPLVSINKISPLMNFSTVRVRGVLVSDARKLRSGSALYMVDDGSGILPVFLICPPEKKLPNAGCRIIVEGRPSIGVGHRRMRVFSEEQVAIEALTPIKKREGEILFSDVTAGREAERITVRGRVIRVWIPSDGSKAPCKIVLSDASGLLEIVHWLDLEKRVAVGDELHVTGQVGLYKGKIQLKVFEPSGISIRSN